MIDGEDGSINPVRVNINSKLLSLAMCTTKYSILIVISTYTIEFEHYTI